MSHGFWPRIKIFTLHLTGTYLLKISGVFVFLAIQENREILVRWHFVSVGKGRFSKQCEAIGPKKQSLKKHFETSKITHYMLSVQTKSGERFKGGTKFTFGCHFAGPLKWDLRSRGKSRERPNAPRFEVHNWLRSFAHANLLNDVLSSSTCWSAVLALFRYKKSKFRQKVPWELKWVHRKLTKEA